METRGFAKPFRFSIQSPQGNTIRLFAVPENHTTKHHPGSIIYPDPLAQRGWTLQEKLLSTRMVSFGMGELEWLCGTATACECVAGKYSRFLEKQHRLNVSAHAINFREGALRFWCAQVSQYSDRTLTYGHDKLPATSGLVRALAPKIGSRYLAGVREGDLARGLAWAWCSRLRIDGPYRAPSWSWASVDGAFEYRFWRPERPPLLKACEYATTPKDGDLYGETCDGEIKVYAVLFRITLYHENEVKWRAEYPRPALTRIQCESFSLDGMLDIPPP
jgi:hypothetical protein